MTVAQGEAMCWPSEKLCTRCGETKPLDAFSRLARGKYGRCAHCKRCRSVRNAAAQRTARGSDPTYIWPRPLTEQLLDLKVRNWRYPATAGQLTWRV